MSSGVAKGGFLGLTPPLAYVKEDFNVEILHFPFVTETTTTFNIIKYINKQSQNLTIIISRLRMVAHGGALVETTPFDRRVVDSNPALAVM